MIQTPTSPTLGKPSAISPGALGLPYCRPTEHNDFINWIREGIVKSKGESHGNAIDQFAAYVLDYTRFIASSAGFATDAKGTCQIICEIILAEEDPKPEDVNDARLAVSNVASDLKVLEEKLDKLHKDLLRVCSPLPCRQPPTHFMV